MDTPNPIESFNDLRHAAEQGNPLAQHDLAICYGEGRNVSSDPARAFQWFSRAAEQGYAPAQFELGLCFKHGQGVPQDATEAVKWFRKAAELGDTSAQFALSTAYEYGKGVEKDQEESLLWLRKAAESGDTRAQYVMGLEYKFGERLALDLVEGAKWIRRAAEAGEAAAQSSYGNLLFSGKGVEKNRAQAVEWYRKAAAQGDETGEYCLGLCYAYGFGTEEDFEEARKWFQLAARKNYRDAKYRLRLLFFRKYSIFKLVNVTISSLGWAFLIFYAIRFPISINGRAVAAFLGIFAAIGIAYLAFMAVVEKLGMKGLDEKDADKTTERLFSELKKRPWKFLLIPAEDGFFLLPLLYIGINPVSAAVAALLFAVFHYPSFQWCLCIPKGIAYFFVALFILPYGIWAVVLGHLLIDFIAFTGLLLGKVGGKPTLRRLLEALQTK